MTNIKRDLHPQIHLQPNNRTTTQNKNLFYKTEVSLSQNFHPASNVLNNRSQIKKGNGNISQQNIIYQQLPPNNIQTIKNKMKPSYLSEILVDDGRVRPSSQQQRQIELTDTKGKAQTEKDYKEQRKKRSKMPESVLFLIRSLAKEKKYQISETQLKSFQSIQQKQTQKSHKSEISKNLFKKYKQLNKRSDTKFFCEICACQYLQVQKVNISNNKCKHFFCNSCLRHYIDYKVGKFEQIFCPAQQCNEQLDDTTSFFHSLSDVQKQKSKKIQKFYSVAKNPNIRLCPDQHCLEGILTLLNDQNKQQQLRCNKCNKIYCKQCFLPQHAGKCDRNEINFFQNNLHYRQCSYCKKIVEKSQGCNHMTCICGFQFCYMCGRKWTGYNHKCSMVFNTVMRSYQCFQNCSQIGGEGVIGQIIRIVIKIFIGTPFFILLMIALLVKALLITIVFFVLTCLLGPTYYACRFICQYGGCCCCFLVIIFPITILIGLGAAFCDLFIQVFLDAWIGFGDEVKEVTEGVFKW